MSEGAVPITEEIEELRKKLALLGEPWSTTFYSERDHLVSSLKWLADDLFCTDDWKLTKFYCCDNLILVLIFFLISYYTIFKKACDNLLWFLFGLFIRLIIKFISLQLWSELTSIDIFCSDGDRKAYYESSQWTMKKNKDTIAKLREKNKRLRSDLAKKKAVSEGLLS